jgi:uncharacterized protein Yka (UPF0111/DUF47 family)
MAGQVSRRGSLFEKLFQDYENHVAYAEQIKELELECEAQEITGRLNSSFITPIDREDIYLLVTELDDVIDMLTDLARRFDIYGVKAPRPDSVEIAGLLSAATAEIAEAFNLFEHHKDLADHCSNIRQTEKRADSKYNAAVRLLFKEEKDRRLQEVIRRQMGSSGPGGLGMDPDHSVLGPHRRPVLPDCADII